MPDEVQDGGHEDTSTVEHASTVIEGLLSGEEFEDQETDDAAPTQSEQDEPATEPTTAEDDDDREPESEDDDEEPKAAAEEAPQKFKVKIDGQEHEVTLEEALKGYSREQDYTRKTQALAEKSRQQEAASKAEGDAVRAERLKYAELLTQLEAATKSLTKEPDWEQLQKELSPEDFAATFSRWQIHDKRVKAIEDERQRAEAAVFADKVAEHQTLVNTERAKLNDAIPAWKDAEVAKKERGELIEYGRANGYSDADILGVVDHRALVLLRKAMLFDRAETAKAAAKPAAKAALERVRVAPPGSPASKTAKVSDATKAKQRHAKTGSLESAAAAFLHILPDE